MRVYTSLLLSALYIERLINTLGRMPILIDTLRMKRRINDIQRETGRIDDRVEALERDVLYVSIETAETAEEIWLGVCCRRILYHWYAPPSLSLTTPSIVLDTDGERIDRAHVHE
jgi:hypothetical protein